MPPILPDIRSIPTDLSPPRCVEGGPAPGIRVRQTLPPFASSDVHHTLYLPKDWRPNHHYPVIVEYAGNGPYENEYGDVCSGLVEDCSLGYGISGGQGFIWACLPFVSDDGQRNQRDWWGDEDATVAYCLAAVERVCSEYGGDPTALILAGFSRGAIACNYIGLRNDEIASLWRAFVAHSHYDGVREWPYPGCDRASALTRLRRLEGRPQFVSHERSTAETQAYLTATGIAGAFTFVDLPYRNHTDTWVLRDIPERARLREWVHGILEK